MGRDMHAAPSCLINLDLSYKLIPTSRYVLFLSCVVDIVFMVLLTVA